MQTLVRDVEKLWNGKKASFEQRIAGWVNDVNKNKAKTEEARKRFHQWDPLRVYTSVSRIKNAPAYFSLRFFGQEVAVIQANGKQAVQLSIEPKHVNWTERDFDKNFRSKFNAGKIPWDSARAKRFRELFKAIKNPTPHSREHLVETEIINSMKKFPSKSGISNIQPVFFADCPLQVPLPIKGSSGVPEESRGGNMDILARRGKGGRNARLSVWELKKPGMPNAALIKAIKQSIIYASTLRMVLRSQSGPEWYKLFGFNGRLPKNLKIEAVLTIAHKDKDEFEQAKKTLSPWTPLCMGNDSILPHVAYYNDATYKVQQIIPIN
ncbi:hypothetical protein [Desulfosudis oleivorans]|uniref:Uncharacterized protein n=1 Tax=Desulfosudis oleivorans (strain DSM 6200 / JCM 39069 / Hxd3) TaxID=96561 RepID=A8ZS51_DESOH|nr:hypothetical protein [Desulfosudis oleivorans]ABW66069.1 hypothetical protein Dole_0259 [Desulfosudis oleivorans Hxd3]